MIKREYIIWFILFAAVIGTIIFLSTYNIRVDGAMPTPPVEPSPVDDLTSNKIVQVYYDDTFKSSYKNIRYDLVTDVLWSFVRVDGDGNLNYASYGDPDDMISYTHSKGVRAILSFRDIPGEANQFLGSSDTRTNAVNNLLDEVKRRGFDGIDIDIENAYQSQHIRSDMTLFIQELYNTFKASNPDYRVSIAVRVIDSDNIFYVEEIKDYVDYLMIMAYDICSSDSSISGPVAPMDNPDDACYGTSVNQGIDYWKNSGMPVNKTLLGIPYYGFDRETDSNERLANVDGSVKWVRFDNIPKYDYYRHFDSSWKTPWQVWQEDGQWHQLQYEDVESLSYKYDRVKKDNLAGIGIWAINYALKRQDLWQLIEDKFIN